MKRRICRWFGHRVEIVGLNDDLRSGVAVRCRRCGLRGTAYRDV